MRYLLVVLLAASALAQDVPESWIDSPEAYFVTAEERKEWNALPDRAQRESFKDRYWLRRDPTGGTPANEFRDTVLGRIKTADARFGIQKIPGSSTHRGKVFIVLGTPSRAKELYAPRPDAPPPPGAPASRQQVGMVEGNEVTHVWSWDRERTPRLMAAIDRPTLEIEIVLEPSKRRDRLQNPGLFNDLQRVLSEKSIANREMVSPMASSSSKPNGPAASIPLSEGMLAEDTQKRISQAIDDPRFELASSYLFDREGQTNLLVYATTTAASFSEPLSFLVEVDGKSIAHHALTTAKQSADFLSPSPATTYSALFRLPQTSGVTRISVGAGSRIIKTRRVDFDGSAAYRISSPILTGGTSAGDRTSTPLLQFGPHAIRPRVGGPSFSPTESVWYFFQVRGRTAPKLELLVQLRGSDGKMRGASPFKVELERDSDQVHYSGYELPLAELSAGNYSLYLTFRDLDTNESTVRRADFQVRQE